MEAELKFKVRMTFSAVVEVDADSADMALFKADAIDYDDIRIGNKVILDDGWSYEIVTDDT